MKKVVRIMQLIIGIILFIAGMLTLIFVLCTGLYVNYGYVGAIIAMIGVMVSFNAVSSMMECPS